MRDKKSYEQPFAAPHSKRPKKMTKGVARQIRKMIRTHELDNKGVTDLIYSYGLGLKGCEDFRNIELNRRSR